MPDPSRPPGLDRWILPGELARATEDGAGRTRRTARDWAVDVAAFGLSVAVFAEELTATVLPDAYDLPLWMRVADVVLGALACLALWWRRRYPVALGLFAVVAGTVSNTGTAAVLLLLFSLAVHRGRPWAVPAGVVGILLAILVTVVIPTVGDDGAATAVFAVLVTLLAVASGLAVRARRRLVLVLRQRADEARGEQERRREESRRDERERIAREMHDVLAHRISLLSVHAGALEYRTAMAEQGAAPALTAGEVHAAVGLVRSNAHQALEELREVLQVLRGPDGAGERPQPTAERLPALLEEARRGGQEVRAAIDGDLGALRPQVQRTVYRLVQEGLTNARKHAPGAAVDVVVRTTPGQEVVVELANPVPAGVAAPVTTGAGAGLTGLAERVELHGGRLTRVLDGGTFRLGARLPWSP